MRINKGNVGFYRVLLILNFSILACILFSQQNNIGIPIIQSYSRDTYKAGTQNWDATIAFNNRLFWANNDGALSFDGHNWHTYEIPNKTIIRSITSHKDRVYFGAQDDIGYFEPDTNGDLSYHSLKHTIDSSQASFTDVWDIEKVNEWLVFRADNAIYLYDGNKTKIIYASSTITCLTKMDNAILFHDLNRGILSYKNGVSNLILNTEHFVGKSIIDIIPTGNQSFFILTEKDGIHFYDGKEATIFNNDAQQYLIANRINSGIKLRNNNLAIGTFLGGIIILNPDGKTQYKLNKSNGLQNNNISTLLEDQTGNLWSGTYNGIDKIELSTGMTYFSPDGETQGAVFDIENIYGKYFFATNSGLYCIDTSHYYDPFTKKDFQFIANTTGEAWGLDVIDDELILSHNDGAFIIDKKLTAKPLSSIYGSWKCLKLEENIMIQGTYNGLYVYHKSKGSWKLQNKVPDFNESSRFLVKDQEKNVWVSHPYRGVFLFNHNGSYKDWKFSIMDSTHLLDGTESHVFNIDNKAYVSNSNGLFEYQYENLTFKKVEGETKTITNSNFIKRIIQKGNSYWYIGDQLSGRLKLNNNQFKSSTINEPMPALNRLFVGGFEYLFPINENEVFVCTNDGVQYYNPTKQKPNTNLKPTLTSVTISSIDSIIYGGHGPFRKDIKLAYDHNDLLFHYALLENPKDLFFSYKLEGFDEDWSVWSEQPFKEYTNLDNKDYTFHVRSNKAIDKIQSFSFIIKPGWYETPFAYFLYTLFGLLILALLLLIPRRKFKKTEADLLFKQEQTERHLEKIKSEKLENEIIYKNKELASSTLHLLQKNETLDIIRTELEKVVRNVKDTQAKKEIKKIGSLLRSDLRLENDWGKFSIHFDQVHHDFIKRLKKDFPELSTKDQKLCAYLRMNLQTKEIAPLLNISVRGVEISRYRLRKKLSLEKETNLNEFMMNY